jgi:hypothetical protein
MHTTFWPKSPTLPNFSIVTWFERKRKQPKRISRSENSRLAPTKENQRPWFWRSPGVCGLWFSKTKSWFLCVCVCVEGGGGWMISLLLLARSHLTGPILRLVCARSNFTRLGCSYLGVFPLLTLVLDSLLFSCQVFLNACTLSNFSSRFRSRFDQLITISPSQMPESGTFRWCHQFNFSSRSCVLRKKKNLTGGWWQW